MPVPAAALQFNHLPALQEENSVRPEEYDRRTKIRANGPLARPHSDKSARAERAHIQAPDQVHPHNARGVLLHAPHLIGW